MQTSVMLSIAIRFQCTVAAVLVVLFHAGVSRARSMKQRQRGKQSEVTTPCLFGARQRLRHLLSLTSADFSKACFDSLSSCVDMPQDLPSSVIDHTYNILAQTQALCSGFFLAKPGFEANNIPLYVPSLLCTCIHLIYMCLSAFIGCLFLMHAYSY